MYVIKLDGGKYIVKNDNGLLTFLRHGEAWPPAQELAYSKVVLAMAQRIEELETAVKAVLDGSLMVNGNRVADGIRSYGSQAVDTPVRRWEQRLRRVLEQK